METAQKTTSASYQSFVFGFFFLMACHTSWSVLVGLGLTGHIVRQWRLWSTQLCHQTRQSQRWPSQRKGPRFRTGRQPTVNNCQTCIVVQARGWRKELVPSVKLPDRRRVKERLGWWDLVGRTKFATDGWQTKFWRFEGNKSGAVAVWIWRLSN